MTDLLIRSIDPDLRRQLTRRAQAHRRSLSDEAKILLRNGLRQSRDERKGGGGLGTAMRELVRPEDLGDDLIFEIPGDISSPPDFE
jgi:plasmid stability protein